METVLLNHGTEFAPNFEESQVPTIQLSFDYDSVTLKSSDLRERFFLPTPEGTIEISRDLAAESRARYLLESFGAVEVSCIEQLEPGWDTKADYLVKPEGTAHHYCSFGAYAVPQLKKMGWFVEYGENYPYHVVPNQPSWYVQVDPESEDSGWFNLQLGIELEGEKIDLVDVLLDLLDASPENSTLKSITRGNLKCAAVPVGKNRYLPVPAEQVQGILKILRDLYENSPVREKIEKKGFSTVDATGKKLFINESDAVRVVELGDELTLHSPIAPQFYGGEEILRMGRALLDRKNNREPLVIRSLQATLRPYQEEGVAWLQNLRQVGACGILADDMGLGKTLQTIAHLAAEKESRLMESPSLLLVPTSLVGNWEREIKKFAPHLRVLVLTGPKRQELYPRVRKHDVVITTYPLLIRDEEFFQNHEFHFVILDEAQAIKNTTSLAHKAVKKVRAKYRLCLSGTPVENHLGELWAMFDFIMPGLLGDAEGFRRRFRLPIEQGGDVERLAQLRNRVKPFILRRLKNLVATDLPPKTELVRAVAMKGAQRELYEAIRLAAHQRVRQTIKKRGLAASTVTILDALMKLRQVCCDPRLVPMDAAKRITQSAKFELLMKMLDQQLAGGHRILIFSQFTSMLELLSQGLNEKGIKHIALTGSTQDRQGMCDVFERGEVDVFLISLKAGGTGLNLTSADTVIHYDPWWNPAAQAQATDRAYRLGQKRPVFAYNLIIAGSVEEKMLAIQQKKRNLADGLLEGGTAKLDLSMEDLDDLFAPLSADDDD